MARYAEKACYDCGLILPVPELHSWSDTSKSGHSDHYGSKGRKSTTTHWRTKRLLVCRECRNKRFGFAVFKLLLLGALIYGAFLYFSKSGNRPTEKLAESAAPEAPAISETETASEEPETEVQQDAEQFADYVDSQPDSQASPAEPHNLVANDEPVQSAPSEIDLAIEDATHRTLDSGISAKWSADGMRGFAVASAEQSYGDRTCRNVLVTTIKGGSQKEAPAEMWCRFRSGGKWVSGEASHVR